MQATLRWAALVLVASLALGGCDAGSPVASRPPLASQQSGGASARPGQGTSVATPGSTAPGGGVVAAAPAGSPGPTPIAAAAVPLAVVTGFANYALNAMSLRTLVARLAAGRVLVPCAAEASIAAALGTSVTGWSTCVAADRIAARLPASSTAVALLPPGLVGPGVKAVPLNGADLFGERPARSAPYPLVIPSPGWPASWTIYDPTDVRVVLTTGVNCADRGVSRQTNSLKKGWSWLLNAGTARYTGTHFDTRLGWNVVDAVRTGSLGAIRQLIRDADIAVSDFECPMSSRFVQHDHGTVFTVDPRVASLMKDAGFDVVTLASDHMTNAGIAGLTDTIRFFDQAGIRHVGAGASLAAALKPAVVTVRGLRFAFYGLNAAGGSIAAGRISAGTAPLTAATIRAASAAARRVADVVVALPQWSTSEYRAAFLSQQLAWRDAMYAAGTDHVIGADFHWAGALALTPGGASGNHLAIASQGNFWFGQDWSRQTEEGYMTMLTFQGTRLAQVRLIPTVVLDDAQPNLINPATDGQFVLHQVLGASIIKPR